jgi:tripartite-type tricarboxylate transporter receptor subunit TctC
MTDRLTFTRRKLVAGSLAGAAVLPFAGSASAQAWPSKPIKIVCAYPASGLTDLYARAYGEYIQQQTGQTVLVENKTGAGGILAAQTVKAAPADGYTLMFTIATSMIMNRVLYKELPYDADKDFVLISSMGAGGLPFIVHKSTGASSVKDFFEWSKTNKSTYGTYAAGSASHIIITELNKHFGTKIEVVHYRGEAPMWQDFNAGVIQAASGSYPGSVNIMQTGTGKAVAVSLSGPKRMKKLPDVPTFLELGMTSKVFSLRGFICLVGPTGMPPEAVEKLSQLMVAGGKSERVMKLLDSFGVDEGATSHTDFRKLYDYEKPIWIELVQGLGLTPQ